MADSIKVEVEGRTFSVVGGGFREMQASLRADYERYSFRSKSGVKQQIGRRMAMLEHALSYAEADLTTLDSQAISTLVKAGHVVKGEINNPTWAMPSRERPR